ncbi:putative signal transducing protein [Thalassotalea agarivorans]|uniref:Putative signal transducing protein n=1 Tax=Thalassotalea agarivorans TaxID=349064 RepID=A0A1I0ED60_THASX|nr:DUF2007 domain-containing protein [Thalassotalea agarivorans]SET42336.1 Putative signal transducing protein [Thalassotalea agarivorans]
MSKLVVVARFSYPLNANIAKAALDTAGIDSFVADEHTINMQWLYSDAMGGVRLYVNEDKLEQARSILATDFSDDVVDVADTKPHCQNCGSEDMVAYTQGKKPAFVVFLLLGFPLFFYRHGMRCNQCGAFQEY